MHKFLYLFLLTFLFALPGFGQFIFQNLGELDGMDSKDALCIFKDKDGFLWIGTAKGLNRYDGNLIRAYPNPRNLKNIEVNSIFPIDRNSNLLLGTSIGVLVFEKSTGTYLQDDRFQALANKHILSLKKDGFGHIWIVTANEIYIFSGRSLIPAEAIFPDIKKLFRKNLSFAARNAFCWDEARQGFWVGGYQAFFIDCRNKAVYDSLNNPRNYPILRKPLITAITLDANHNLWYASTRDFSVSHWDYRNNHVSQYNELGGKRPTDGINFLYVDKNKRLWLSTWMYAAYHKEPGKPIQKIPYSQDSPNSIAYGYIQDALEDPDGNLWLATINGVSKLADNIPFQAIYKLPSYKFFLETNFAHANSIAVDQGQIFAAKEDGAVQYDMRQRTFHRYAVSEKDFVQNRFSSTAKCGNTWWFAGHSGVFFLNQEKGALEKLKKGPEKPANAVFSDHKNRIWFHTLHDAIYRYNPQTKKLDRFDGTDPKWGKFKYGNVQSYLALKNGDLLFAIKGSGFLRFSDKSQQFSMVSVRNPGTFDVKQSIEDSDGNIWSTIWAKGIYKISPDGVFLDSLVSENGLLFSRINSIAQDSRGAVWAAGSDGLLFFFSKTKKITRVQINLGKTLQDYWNYVYATKDRVYAVMLDHVVEIDPMKFAKLPVQKPPLITSIKVFGNEIRTADQTTIQLTPQENYITFQYASLSHRDIPSLQYSYKLEGIDNDWIDAGRDMTVGYNSLKPGYYNFKVRSTDENGLWMKNITIVRLQVLPHWWQTWWFFILAGTLSAAFLDITYSGYLNRKQKAAFDKTIAYFANSVYGENSVNEICWDIARNCISQLHFEDCVVYLWDNGKQKLIQKATYGTKNTREHEILNPLELTIGEGIVGTAAAEKRPLIVNDTRKDPRYIVDDEKRLSEIAVPILHEGKVIGVLDSEHSQKRFFTSEHARVLSTIASISANKIAEAQAEEQAQQKEMMLLEINKMLAESQLMALRAQMNPHFVFNCLNSIQECIVTEKYGEASKYLNKFSKLFRMVLNNSDKNLVTIEDENLVLQLYLELESMRFENSFKYEIRMDELLDADEILLPSMLLQPYVENALWHGLMHKDGDRKLIIWYQKISDDIFKCMIDDNGIGRKKSIEGKQFNSKAKRHQSKGLQIAKDRLNLLERQGKHASVEIIDKYGPDGDATGTLVVIELSTLLNTI